MAFANHTSSVEDIDEDSRELLEAEKGSDSEPEVVFSPKMFTALCRLVRREEEYEQNRG